VFGADSAKLGDDVERKVDIVQAALRPSSNLLQDARFHIGIVGVAIAGINGSIGHR
jgi:hypothetical protein